MLAPHPRVTAGAAALALSCALLANAPGLGVSAALAQTEAEAETPADAATLAPISAQRSFAWVAVGTAAAFLTSSIVLALSAESREDEMNYLIGFRTPGDGLPSPYAGPIRDRYEELGDEGRRLARYSWITLGLAGASAAAAVALFVTEGGAAASDERARHLRPTLLPGGAGISAGWRF
ncbi:hypothetical protein [Haliangium ochraceum]|uniref:TPR repeat-containing protein n=1 Tax=Haliangium ochraceum (strain DSM 14365 / JCM 11303 / SMP-2) TaxID=502025 RepID=D0LKY1_HALO1|nr:hypothetical protein [Haliangium ochraceum]ACY16701.1 TPR repeat-containing protein [Haliangium ochraceum DSM 14365]